MSVAYAAQGGSSGPKLSAFWYHDNAVGTLGLSNLLTLNFTQGDAATSRFAFNAWNAPDNTRGLTTDWASPERPGEVSTHRGVELNLDRQGRRLEFPVYRAEASKAVSVVDLVVVIDSSGSMADEATALSQAIGAAIEAAKTKCPSDLRATYLGIENVFKKTLFNNTVRAYLNKLGVPDSAIKGRKDVDGAREDGARAMEDIATHFDWRPGAKRAIFYLGDEALEGGNPQNQDDIDAANSAIETARKTGTTVHTYLGTAAAQVRQQVEAEYARVARETGGQSFTSLSTLSGFQEMLEKVICNSSCLCCQADVEKDARERPIPKPVPPEPQRGFWSWGANDWGQLGDGTNTNRNKPMQEVGLLGVKALAAGGWHNLALLDNGAVWTWGANNYGQLGYGHTTVTPQPTKPADVALVTGVKAIAACGWTSLALVSDGTVRAWGRNTWGNLGDGTTTDSNRPVQVAGLAGVKAIAAGSVHSLALREDGTLWAWGLNNLGQLGDGTLTQRERPVKVSGLGTVKAIAAGRNYEGAGHYSLALLEDGTVWAWGANNWGQLGDGTNVYKLAPVKVPDLGRVKAIAAGGWHNLALLEDGTVWSWGANNWAQLGNGVTDPVARPSKPVKVLGLAGVKAISANYYHNLALLEDGTVWIWGANNYGQIGSVAVAAQPTPLRVPELTGVKAIAAGGWHSLATV
ncbi:hypothetical protein WME89_25195 [Sorangium sp. So ce321]|uniref:RCC1 domain-containing protein n=1 Tax=Sorangium sp. So ce321 TaxID=3133300 RepID=UPI003F5DE67D